MQIRLATPTIQRNSIVDGEGIRAVIWTQGCTHNCPGCHNPETHSFSGGELVDVEKIKEEISDLTEETGITLSGGDPMCQMEACREIAKHAHQCGLNVWCYTGYTFERLMRMAQDNPDVLPFLKEIDVLVDGPFILKEKSFDAMFRGSKNQRVINVPKSLKQGKVVEVGKYKYKEQSRKIKPLNNQIYI